MLGNLHVWVEITKSNCGYNSIKFVKTVLMGFSIPSSHIVLSRLLRRMLANRLLNKYIPYLQTLGPCTQITNTNT